MTTKLASPRAVWTIRPRNVWVCIGSGSSVMAEDVEYCIGRAHIAVCNSSFYLCPEHVEILHASDGKWWDRHIGAVNALTPPYCQRYTTSTVAARRHKLSHIQVIPYQAPNGRRPRAGRAGTSLGWSTDPTRVYSGGLTGYQLTQIVGFQRPSKIVLLGYDMCEGPDGEIHHHPDHEAPLTNMSKMRAQRHNFESLARLADVPIINCSRRSALTCFPRRELRRVLK